MDVQELCYAQAALRYAQGDVDIAIDILATGRPCGMCAGADGYSHVAPWSDEQVKKYAFTLEEVDIHTRDTCFNDPARGGIDFVEWAHWQAYRRGDEPCATCGQFITDQHKFCCNACDSRCGLKYGCESRDCGAEEPPAGMYRNEAGGYQYPSETI